MIRTNRHFDIPSKLYRKLVNTPYDIFKEKYRNDKQLLEHLKQYDI